MNLFSYVTPKTVYEGSTTFNKNIKIIRVLNTYKLMVDGVTQSYGKKSKYAKGKVWGSMARIINKSENINNLLLLGVGAGTLLNFLTNKYKRGLTSTSVEIDPIVVLLAQKYFDLNLLKSNKIIESDAYDVVQNPLKYNLPTPFDCVAIDTYSGSDFPKELASDKFYKNVVSIMSEQGLLIVNRIINKEDKTSVKEYKAQLQKYINPIKINVIKYPILSDNYIFYGSVKK